jgi:hypothetical protein
MKVQKITLIDGLYNELRSKFKIFNERLNSISRSLKYLDSLSFSSLKLFDYENFIIEDPFLLFKANEIAWPKSIEDLENISIPLKTPSLENLEIISFSYNIENFQEILPPFQLYELSIFKKWKKTEKNYNLYRIKFLKKISRDNELYLQSDFLKEIFELIIDFLSHEREFEDKVKILISEIPFSCTQAFNMPKEERDKIFEIVQNLLVTLKSLGVIPISINKYNGSPVLSTILHTLEKMGRKEEFIDIELINDKLFLAGKLKTEERTPLFHYTNHIIDNPYLKERLYLFYIRFDVDYIERIEIPSYATNQIELIHSVLLNEYRLAIRKFKQKGYYSLFNANRNLLSKRVKRKDLINLIDLMIKDEMVKNYKKKIGLIANFV